MKKFKGEEFDEKIEFFDAMAQSDWFKGMQEELCGWIGHFDGEDLLDIGCGTGRLLLRKASRCRSASGIDLSIGMVETARSLAEEEGIKVEFLHGDAERLPFQKKSFDIALSTCVLFLMPEPKQMIKEMNRILKPGGKAALLNPSPALTLEKAAEAARFLPEKERPMMEQWGRVAEKRHRFSEEIISKILKDNGFTYVSSKRTENELGLITIAGK
nr:class I SAM-dependent methyltransferase [Alkalicoccus halolimnae]